MKNILFLALICCLTIISCTRDNVDLNQVESEEELESRYCENDYHCSDFPTYNSVNTCDLDLTSFVFTPNPGSTVTGIMIEITSTSGWSLNYDPSLGSLDPNVDFVDSNGQLLTGSFNQLIIECGETVTYHLWDILPNYKARRCIINLVCDEECCVPNDCCDGTEISYKILESTISPFGFTCCKYEITVTNNNDCENTLFIQGAGTFVLPPNTKHVEVVEVCKKLKVTIHDDEGNLCYEDEINCSCCSLVEVVIEERDVENGSDCCFYTVWLTNHGNCKINMKDKLGNLVISLLPGQTDSSWQKACDGIDEEFEIFTLGQTEPCEIITLKSDCHEPK